MKKSVLIFMSVAAYLIASAQSRMVKEVFRLLPAYKVYDLTVVTRDSMLQGKTYYPKANDKNEIQAYNYGTSAYTEDYLYVSMSFETEQRGSGMIEIRSFKMTNGDNLVVVSKTGGVWQVSYNQHDLSAFVYDKSKKLIQYKKRIFPATNERVLMKPGIPDSVKKIIMNNSNMTFDLSHEKLTLSLNSDYISNNKISGKWLKGDRVYFDWVKDHFVISKIEFQ